MMRLKQSLAVLILAGTVTGCDTKDWDATGYADGYATTVSANCGREAPLVDGRYDKFKYARGYARGAKSAAEDVQSKGCANLTNP
jgi:hypothetical protein